MKTTASIQATLLFLFITLKILGIIDWSWTWVLSPVWLVPSVFIVGLFLFRLYQLTKTK